METHPPIAASLFFISAATATTLALYSRKHKKVAFFRGPDMLHPPPASSEEGGQAPSGAKVIKYKSVKDSKLSSELSIKDLECAHIHQANLLEIPNLGKTFKGAHVQNLSQMSGTTSGESIAYNKLLGHQDGIIADIVRREGLPPETKVYVRAGPRKELHFEPEKVRAAIVTCGGLCPGLNNVIRELVNSLFHLYRAQSGVYGIRGGFSGFHDAHRLPIMLTPELVDQIHHEGGTILGSSRGGFDIDKIIHFLEEKQICQLYIIGGDGTHRGANKIGEECLKRGLNIAVVGIPKTIDNDVDLIDRSFGFQTSVEAAQAAIRCAKTEAICNLPNGIGVVKLMGRSAGFIAVHATLASGDVDLCLIPEVPIVLEGERGCLPHLAQRVQQKGHAVVVVAEGAGEELLGQSAEKDASGNKKLPAIGQFLKEKIGIYFKSQGQPSTVKYIDPSYMVRSVPANAADSIYCSLLAQNAVHGAMAGFTQFTVGLCNNRLVYLPIPLVVATSPRVMDPVGRTWERVLSVTRQPNTAIQL
ncbi:6-phosphofructo-2-kinase / fructose-2,6-bisphosphatase, partial [Nannochloropsis gaditana CCMP526]|uniref:6-phosphofructo-2-kinase / fructose-2,6-bisphosphatase n=1 Tax=Nannochloropsis gaditana (strain CCMP526) TaxID=1093141 RepID=UPI00029F7B7D